MSGRRRSARGRAAAPTAPEARGGLSPHGALAARFGGERAADDVFRRLAAGARRFDLGDHGALLAEELLRLAPMLAGPDRTAVALALLATDVAARQGSTCVPLAPGGPLRELVAALVAAAGLDLDVDEAVASVRRVAGGGQLGFGAPIGPPDGKARPLVADGDLLYQHRLWWLERALAERLAPRLAAAAAPAPEVTAAVDDVVARPGAFTLTGEQAAAVRAALGGPLGVISGGPGTGKTAIVVAIVRALERLGAGPIALAAPTGKAANRMTSSVRAAVAAIADAAPADAALAATPPAALTLHRLLGWRPDGEFRHGERSPLPHAAVIVDEASMIDLALMERLVRALAPGARLILLGDADQLPSVDAGAVLADLVAAARARGAAWATELTESHRMRPDDPDGAAVLEAARRVRAGDARPPGHQIGFVRPTGRRVERAPIDPPARLGETLDRWLRDLLDETDLARLAARAYRRRAGAWLDEDAAPLAALLELHERRRILAVTRGLDTGAEAVNAHLHRRMLERSSAELAPEVVPGEPVIMTVNDYERGLYNGDQGVVVRVVDDDGAQRYRAVFRRGDELVPLPLDAVRASMELAWAITVHKSQGSEFDRVAIVLPREDQPLCTRELIYTALTRARTGALILGADEVLAAACARTAARASGLVARILGDAP